MKSKRSVLVLIIFAVIIILSSYVVIYTDKYYEGNVIKIITLVSTLTGLFGILYSFKLDRDISESSFVYSLYSSFHGNERIQRLQEKLEKVFLGEKISIIEDDRRDVVEYLTFFEALASMEARGVISINCFDQLFGYDFFILVNNSDVIQLELSKYSMYYMGTIELIKKWRHYRIKHNLAIPLEDNHGVENK